VSHGVLAIGGIISMALGSLMLFDAPELGFRVSWWAIVPMVGLTSGMFLFVVAAGVQALRRRQMLGPSGLVGQFGTVRERLAPEGQILVQGEIWRAITEEAALEPGARVRVLAVDGLTLTVGKADAEGRDP
jgi:membrane-bound serine protease (ClpP class)